jgi:hypothetical protein
METIKIQESYIISGQERIEMESEAEQIYKFIERKINKEKDRIIAQILNTAREYIVEESEITKSKSKKITLSLFVEIQK